MHRQSTGGAEHRVRHLGQCAGGVDQRGGFAHDAPRCQNYAGQNAGHRAGQHHAEHRAQLTGTQTEAALAVGIRHRQQGFLGGAHNDRQHHNGQRKGARHQAVAPVQRIDKEQHTEQAVHNGRDALQRFGGDAHQAHQLAAARGVLHQPDRRKDAQRCGNDQREGGHKQCVDERRHQRNVVGGVLPREKLRLEVGDAHNQNIPDQKHQHGGGQQRCQPHKTPQHSRLNAGGGAVFAGGQHSLHARRGGGGAGIGGNIRHGRCLLSQG